MGGPQKAFLVRDVGRWDAPGSLFLLPGRDQVYAVVADAIVAIGVNSGIGEEVLPTAAKDYLEKKYNILIRSEFNHSW